VLCDAQSVRDERPAKKEVNFEVILFIAVVDCVLKPASRAHERADDRDLPEWIVGRDRSAERAAGHLRSREIDLEPGYIDKPGEVTATMRSKCPS
jgi:hypothetical protein